MKKIRTGRLIAASPAVNSDILYAGGFPAADEIVWFRADRKNYLAVFLLELDRARSQAKKNVEVLSQELLFRKGDKKRDAAALILGISQKYGIGCWEVPDSFPTAYADSLREQGIEIRTQKNFFPGRAVKTADELRKLAKSMNATQESMLYLKDILHKATVGTGNYLRYQGKILTSEFLIRSVEGFLKAEGFSASSTIIAHGAQCAQPHNVGSGPILAGETIIADIFPRSDSTGYWGDMTRTFVKGKPLPVVVRAHAAVLQASQAAEAMIRDGVPAADVHRKAAAVMEEAGFKTGRNKDDVPCGFIHGLGHGVGLDIHEAPRVSPYNPEPLKAGNVISNEPGLYNPVWGGIRLEDVLTVTENGCRNFYTMSKEMDPDA